MNNNIQSCDITYSDIDNNDNKVLRNMYKNIYCCNYEKYIRLINNNYHIKIKNLKIVIIMMKMKKKKTIRRKIKMKIKIKILKIIKIIKILILIIIKRNQKVNIIEY